MTVLFYQYNSRYLERVTGKPRKQIWYQNATTDIDTTSNNFGIVDKHVQESIWGKDTISNLTFLTSSDFDAVAKTLQVNDTISHLISVEEMMDVLKNAIHLYNTTKSMSSKSGSSSIFNYKFFPFMSSVTSMFFSEVAPQITPPSRLDSVLASWKMK